MASSLLAGRVRQEFLPSATERSGPSPWLLPHAAPAPLLSQRRSSTRCVPAPCRSLQLPLDSSSSPLPSSPSSQSNVSASGFLLGDTTRSTLRRTLKQSRKRVDNTHTAFSLPALLAAPQLHPDVASSIESELRILTDSLRQLSQAAPASTQQPSSSSILRVDPTATTSPAPLQSQLSPSPLPLDTSRPLPAALPLRPCAEGRILVCQGSKCQAAGSADVLRSVSALTAGCPGLEILPSKCLGKCRMACVMRVKDLSAEAATEAPSGASDADAGALRGPGQRPHPKGELYTGLSGEEVAPVLLKHFA